MKLLRYIAAFVLAASAALANSAYPSTKAPATPLTRANVAVLTAAQAVSGTYGNVLVNEDGYTAVYVWRASASQTCSTPSFIAADSSYICPSDATPPATGRWVRGPTESPPITAVTGLGTGVATALGTNVGSAGAFAIDGATAVSLYNYSGNLTTAAAAATAAGKPLLIDMTVSLAGNTVVNAPAFAFAPGAKIVTGSYTLRQNGLLSVPDNQVIYDSTGTGVITLPYNNKLSAIWFGADYTGATNSLVAITRASASLDASVSASNSLSNVTHGGTLYFPAGQYKYTCKWIWGTGVNYTNIVGDGALATNFQFVPGGSCSADADGYYVGMQLLMSGGSGYAYKHNLIGIGFGSSDTTNQKVAVDFVDVGSVMVKDIFVYGSGPGQYFQGGTSGSIGIRIKGRDNSDITDAVMVAQRPIYVDANPNEAATNNEDLDHWNFHNFLWYCKGDYPAVQIADGHGVSNVSFDGRHAIVGCPTFFKLNDTRVSPLINSRNITFSNLRGESGSSAGANYWIDLVADSTGPIGTVSLRDSLLGSGNAGLQITSYKNLRLDNVTLGHPSTYAILATMPSQISSVTMNNVECAATVLFSIAGMASTYVGNHNTNSGYAGCPNTAVYAYSHPSISSYRNPLFGCGAAGGTSGTGETKVCVWKETVAAGVSTILGPPQAGFNATVSATGATASEAGTFYGTSSAVSCLTCTTNMAATDTAGKVSFFYSGSNIYIKNNLAESIVVVITMYIGL